MTAFGHIADVHGEFIQKYEVNRSAYLDQAVEFESALKLKRYCHNRNPTPTQLWNVILRVLEILLQKLRLRLE